MTTEHVVASSGPTRGPFDRNADSHPPRGAFDRSALPPVRSLQGWFQIGWSPEFPADAPVALRYFGRDLVAYRTSVGEIVVFDAYCAHLGAHLAHGGTIEGDCIVCPFHGWSWNPDGSNRSIPYSERVKRNKGKRLNKWHVAEREGLVYMWHHPHGGEPTWDPPTVLSDGADYYPLHPAGAHSWESVLVHPQLALENAADFAHFKWVHRASRVARCVGFEPDGATFKVMLELPMGREGHKTWAADEGGVVAELLVRGWGVGLLSATFTGVDGATNMLNMTPIDDTTSRLMSSTWIPRAPGAQGDDLPERAKARVAEQVRQADRDLVIWEHMAYIPRPPYPPEESTDFLALRKWSEQFYVTTDREK